MRHIQSTEFAVDSVLRGGIVFNISEDICSMTEFKRRTSEVTSRLRGTGRAVILTTNGKADVVVQDAASYQKLLDRLRAYENLADYSVGKRSSAQTQKRS
jgi:prevent-host-death family protein